MFRKVCLIASCLLASATLFAQSYPAAEGSRTSLWVGAEISTFNPDYGCTSNSPFSCGSQLVGISPYASANHLLFSRVGAEAEGHFLEWHGPGSMTETSALAGPRVRLLRYRQARFSGKVLFGEAHFTAPKGAAGSGNYFAYAPGAIVDFRLTNRVFARADYEYQRWPSFKGANTGAGGLTPNGFSFGVSYVLTR